MKEIIKKMFEAKQKIAETKIKKSGKNSYSNYDYFTPEQTKVMVDSVCFDIKLLTHFYIKEMVAYLIVYDIESAEFLTYSTPVEIPEIKATNNMQRIGGVMTYAERYLKMTAFGIVDNNLDFDTYKPRNWKVEIELAKAEKELLKLWQSMSQTEQVQYKEIINNKKIELKNELQ